MTNEGSITKIVALKRADFGASSDIGGYLGGNIHGGGDLDVSNLVNSSGNLSGGGFIRGRGEICEVFN